MIFDLCIVGGGPAGLITAIVAAKRNLNICLIEHNDCLGKKILLTGNGRCNITNLNLDVNCYQGNTNSFALSIIEKFNNHKLIDMFNELGMLTYDRAGYVYPYSNQAATVRDVLANEVFSHKNIKVLLNTHVNKITRNDDFVINDSIYSKNVVITTGSKAYPVTGCDGSGYEFAKNFGHNIREVLPALTSLKTDFEYIEKLCGVRANSAIKLYVNGKEVADSVGEVQFTHYCISGIPVFQISRYAVYALFEKKPVSVSIDFMPGIDRQTLLEVIKKNLMMRKSLGKALCGLLNSKVIQAICNASGTDISVKSSDVNEQLINAITDNMKNLKFNVVDYNGFKYGQVCQGGIDVNELSDNLESTLVKGLYFAGEIVDVDGICGGYNLQWAFSSGYVVGKAICNDKN